MSDVFLEYRQSAFKTPMHNDLDSVHKYVYELMFGSANGQQRDFIFEVTPLDPEGVQALVQIRGTQLPSSVPAEQCLKKVREGRQMKIRITLSRLRRVVGDDGSRKTAKVPVEQQPRWIHELLEKNGMDADSVAVVHRRSYEIERDSGGFVVPSVRANASVTITDPEAFKNAFMNGIGRQKGFGMGFIEVEE